MNKCKFDRAWIGACGAECGEETYCLAHRKVKCTVCGEQATHECPEAGSLVCGYPLCDNCEGYQDKEGRNADFTGFIGTGVHRHRRKKCPTSGF
jgi:hypothetical protein